MRRPQAYFYIRFSTKMQGEEGRDSRRRQTEGAIELAKSVYPDLEIKEEHFYEDDGVSGFSGKNLKQGSKLREIIDQIENLSIKEGDYLFVESIDRISRQSIDQAEEVIKGILRKGVNIVTTLDRQKYTKADISNPQIRMLLMFISSRAHNESVTKRERLLAANAQKRRRAKETGEIYSTVNLPYGINYDKENHQLVIDKKKQKEIKYAFELLKVYGYVEVVNQLNKKFGVETNWNQSRIRKMIQSKYVIGYFHAHKRIDGRKVEVEHIPNYFPKMIDTSTYLEALQAITARVKNKVVGERSKYDLNIFRSILKCSKCGGALHFESSFFRSERDIFYYSCTNKKEKKLCDANRPRFDLIFGCFLKVVFNIKQEYRVFRRLGNSFRKAHYDRLVVKTDKKRVSNKIIKTGYRLIQPTYNTFEVSIVSSKYFRAKSLLQYVSECKTPEQRLVYLEHFDNDTELMDAMNIYENQLIRRFNFQALDVDNFNELFPQFKEFKLKYLNQRATDLISEFLETLMRGIEKITKIDTFKNLNEKDKNDLLFYIYQNKLNKNLSYTDEDNLIEQIENANKINAVNGLIETLLKSYKLKVKSKYTDYKDFIEKMHKGKLKYEFAPVNQAEVLKAFLESEVSSIDDDIKSSMLNFFNKDLARKTDQAEENILVDLEISKSQYQSLERSIEDLQNEGIKVPNKLWTDLAKVEGVKEDLENKLVKAQENKAETEAIVDIRDNKEFLRLFRTQLGRAKINDYLLKKGVILYVVFHKENRMIEVDVRIKNDLVPTADNSGRLGHRIGYVIQKFAIQYPLREVLGFNHGRGTVRDLVDKEEPVKKINVKEAYAEEAPK